MAEIKFRLGTSSDVVAIRDLSRRSYEKWISAIGREPLPMSVDYSVAIKKHRFELGFVDTTLVALLETSDEDDHIFIENVCVDPSMQGRGLGKILVDKAEQHASSVGYEWIRLLTNKAFSGNLIFYKSLGYAVEREEPFRGGTIVYFEKFLSQNNK